MAFSAISTTGLGVVDISSTYSLFGQIVMLVTIQIGGIGYIGLIIIAMGAFGRGSPFYVASVAGEAMAGYETRNLIRFSILVVTVTVLLELAGAALLFIPFMETMSDAKAFYFALFHSVNAFCTAGFSTFPDSLTRYAFNPVVNIVINVLSYIGAIGFIVIYDLVSITRKKMKGQRASISLHSKIVFVSFTGLVLAGTLTLFCVGPWDPHSGYGHRLVLSLFQSLSASSTDGYNSIDIGAIKPFALIFICLQMFVGAAPGSTGGGIKTTTFSTVLLFQFWQLKGRGNTVISLKRREIGKDTAEKALGIAIWFFVIIFVDLLVLSVSEGQRFSLLSHLFETVSALGNTGLSMGITSGLSTAGKLALTATMFVGRVGSLGTCRGIRGGGGSGNLGRVPYIRAT